MRPALAVLLLVATTDPPGAGATPQELPVPVVLMEPDPGAPPGTPIYRPVEGAALQRYLTWLDNESARRALLLYETAWATMRDRDPATPPTPPYHVAVLPGGNHADQGFRLMTEAGVKDHGELPYIKLGPEPGDFENTFLHETGHVVLSVLTGGEGIPAEPMASIPHTTTALTDRGTAFNEGFAIHLETLAAHLHDDPATRRRYRHEHFDFSGSAAPGSEYFRHASDLRSYAQTVARYLEVRDNHFAFAPACKEPDYLRVQLDKSRDFATLRDANQLLQSEGFHASVFFALTVRGNGRPDQTTVAARQAQMCEVLAETFDQFPLDVETPYLLHFVEMYLDLFPEEGEEVVDVLLDLSHGVFVDTRAQDLWREHYLAALRLDLQALNIPTIQKTRQQWREAVRDDPAVLTDLLGPQVPCQVEGLTVNLVAFGQAAPLSFDVNTVEEGILHLVPGITEEEVTRWQLERRRAPFEDEDDLQERVHLQPETWARLNF